VNEESLVTIVPVPAKALCFTSNRLIVANVNITEWIRLLWVFAMVGGIIIILVANLTWAWKTKQLSKLSVESILTADKKNLAIPYTKVRKVELFKEGRGRIIRIISDTGIQEFNLIKPKEFEDYVNVLRPVLADKMAVSEEEIVTEAEEEVLREEEVERAIEDYDEAIRLNPQDAEAYYNRGTAYLDLGQFERAIQDLDEAIRLNPKYTDAYYNRGNTYCELGQFEQAIADFESFITLTNNPEWIEMARQKIEALSK